MTRVLICATGQKKVHKFMSRSNHRSGTVPRYKCELPALQQSMSDALAPPSLLSYMTPPPTHEPAIKKPCHRPPSSTVGIPPIPSHASDFKMNTPATETRPSDNTTDNNELVINVPTCITNIKLVKGDKFVTISI